MRFRSNISLLAFCTIIFPLTALAAVVICNVEDKTVDFDEEVEAEGISFTSATEAESECKKNLTAESSPAMQRDKDLADFCASKNPDDSKCTLKSASGTIQDDDSGNTTYSAERAKKRQGRWVAECSATVAGSCVFECTTCLPVCEAVDSTTPESSCLQHTELKILFFEK